jgi:hypothetical protein
LPVRHDDLRGNRGGWCAHVSDKVSDREINFVTDCADQRYRAGGDGTREMFIVEGHEVFERAAAAAENQNVTFVAPDCSAERRQQLRWRRLALYGGRIDNHGDRGKPSPEHADDVANRGATW